MEVIMVHCGDGKHQKQQQPDAGACMLMCQMCGSWRQSLEIAPNGSDCVVHVMRATNQARVQAPQYCLYAESISDVRSLAHIVHQLQNQAGVPDMSQAAHNVA
jgi:hypothetical protein